MLPRYALAACPNDVDVQKRFFEWARYLQEAATDYCLSEDKASPHVTLCQFRKQDDKQALTLVRDFLGESLSLCTQGVYVNPRARSDVFWVGCLVERSDVLIGLHEAAVQHLQTDNIKALNLCGARYFPHFTLAKVYKDQWVPTPDFFKNSLLHAVISCRLQLGRLDEAGQWLHTIA